MALLVEVLAKFHVVLELSGESCPLCRTASAHDAECPVALAWSILDTEHRAQVRRDIRAFALSMGLVSEGADTFVH